MEFKGVYTAGSKYGYIRVAERNHESEAKRIPNDLKGMRPSERKALQYLKQEGATHYTIELCQGVPFKGYSNRYFYKKYYGYADTDK